MAELRKSLRSGHINLGTIGRRQVSATFEDSFLLLGPPRSGKTSAALIPWLLDCPGPAVVTSTRDDVLRATAGRRSKWGPAWLFDPGGLVTDADHVIRGGWNLIDGCNDPLTAILRAQAIVGASGSSSGVKRSDFWRGTSETILRCLFHAAAIRGNGIETVYEWVAQQRCDEALSALGGGYGADGWHAELSGIDSLVNETRSNVFAGAQIALSSLAHPDVRKLVGRDGGIDIDAFLNESGTIYILGTPDGQHSVAPVVVALIEAIVDKARRLAASNPNGKLDPPVGLFLDEAAQIAPLPSLPKLVSDGGGTGITSVVVLQSLAQARDRWGQHAADVIWDAATVRMIFSGLANESDLQKISRLCGEMDEKVRSQYPSGPASMTRRRAVMSAADIRGLKKWRALLLYRGLKPAILRVTPHFNERL